jgi:hypothetical protein
MRMPTISTICAPTLASSWEDLDGDHDLGILTGIGLRTQLVTDDLLEPANRDLHPRSLVVAGSLLPTDTPRSEMHVR